MTSLGGHYIILRFLEKILLDTMIGYKILDMIQKKE